MAPKLFLLHGMGGSPEDWNNFEQFLPGLTMPIPKNAMSPEDCAHLLADEIEQTGASPVALAGYSMGGRLAILTALQLLARGIPLTHLVLISTGLGLSKAEERVARRLQDEKWALLAEKNPRDFWKQWYQQNLFASYRALPAQTQIEWETSRFSMEIDGLSHQLKFLGPGNHDFLAPLLEGLLKKGLRVLYIVGELDKKYLELSKKVGRMGKTQVAIIANAGHILPLEAPEILALRVREFLTEGARNG